MIGRYIVSGLFGLSAVCWFGGLVAPGLWLIAIVLTLLAVCAALVGGMYEVITNG